MVNLTHVLAASAPRSIAYRIGDGFFAFAGDIYNFRPKTFMEYPGTLLTDYLDRTTECGNYDILMDIINTKPDYHPADCPFRDDYVLIHLRIGDIMEGPCDEAFQNKAFYDIDSINPHLPDNDFHKIATKYIVPLNWYPNLLPYYHNTNFIIIAASHMNLHKYTNSLRYINEVKNILSKNGNYVYTCLGNHPDNDFLLIKNCRHFIKSTGNYSKLLGEIAKRMGKGINGHPSTNI